MLYGSGEKEEAEKYYRLAAEQGNETAQKNLAELLAETGRTE
ncbi:MAG: hypothetical protein K2N06_05195 [Oscillospiraceae bacterium]|nr:hypothetical protein [Oscillospiraceae bacterium]